MSDQFTRISAKKLTKLLPSDVAWIAEQIKSQSGNARVVDIVKSYFVNFVRPSIADRDDLLKVIASLNSAEFWTRNNPKIFFEEIFDKLDFRVLSFVAEIFDLSYKAHAVVLFDVALKKDQINKDPSYSKDEFRGYTGVVKWFNAKKGYGFIAPEEGGPDVLVHISAIKKAGLVTLTEGQKIGFKLPALRENARPDIVDLRIKN